MMSFSDLSNSPNSQFYNQVLGIQGSTANVVITLQISDRTPTEIGQVSGYFTVVDSIGGLTLRMTRALRRDVSQASMGWSFAFRSCIDKILISFFHLVLICVSKILKLFLR